MLTIKNIRQGILVIPDAGLKLKPGQTVDIEKGTRQIESALKKGYLAAVDHKETEDQKAAEDYVQESDAVDLSKLSASEAISRVNAEADPEMIKEHLETEKRRSVIEALKSRLEDLQGAAH
jgi:ribulose bisphosphate carboxylase small subunit